MSLVLGVRVAARSLAGLTLSCEGLGCVWGGGPVISPLSGVDLIRGVQLTRVLGGPHALLWRVLCSNAQILEHS